MEINVLELYRKFLVPMTPGPAVSTILNVVMSGGETTQDMAEVIARDPELAEWLRISLKRMGRGGKNQSLEYIVSIMGMNRVRNLIIGRHVERSLVAQENTIMGKLLAEREKAPKSGKEDENDDESKVIPEIADFTKYVAYAQRAEQVAVDLKYSHPGQAYAGGVLFDYLSTYFAQLKEFDKSVSDPAFQKPEKYIETIFEDGLRCAVASDEIIRFISITYQKNVFLSSLVRNIGKLILLAYDPKGYERAKKNYEEAVAKNMPARRHEFEEDEFDFDHAQVTALYVGRAPCFRGIEKSLDYHHNPRLLRSRDKELHALSCVLRLSGLLVNVYQEFRLQEADIGKMPDARITNSEVFKFLRLTADEWDEVKQSYAMNLMRAGL